MTHVENLLGTEGGRWRIRTQGSSYVMDLDAMTVTRFPGPDSLATINDQTRPIRSIRQCRVGESGYWTMSADGGFADPVDFFWQVTTIIRSVEQIADDADR